MVAMFWDEAAKVRAMIRFEAENAGGVADVLGNLTLLTCMALKGNRFEAEAEGLLAPPLHCALWHCACAENR